VIVELFTSEGCSSCPPADTLLARLQRMVPDVDVIPLSEHVDYWNHLGWQDRFSAPLFSMRQQDYGRLFKLDSVYTPEMVVNGTAEFSGSDATRAQQEIAKAAGGPRAVTTMWLSGNSAVHLHVEKTPAATRNVDVFLAITETNLETSVQGGENNGKRLRHVGVVRSLSTVGHYDARKAGVYDADAKLNLNSEWSKDNLKLVMFVQDRSNRKIIGASTLHP
jgi:hypothetical protein